MPRLNASEHRFGDLDTIVVDSLPADTPPALLVVLSHGFGAAGDDLAGLGVQLLQTVPELAVAVRFVFPAAPQDLAEYGMPGGRAWWPINMAGLMQMQQTRDYSQLTQLRPPGMTEATAQLAVAIREMQQHWGLADNQLVVGGFSQGAMVSTNLVLDLPLHPALLVIFSCTLLDRAHWEELALRHKGCPVLLSHGSTDDILPQSAAEELVQMLQKAGFTLDVCRFRGGHTIPMNVLAALSESLKKILLERAC
ncbi:MAG: alpha/beta hydrolase [Planctomycetota bacterium]